MLYSFLSRLQSIFRPMWSSSSADTTPTAASTQSHSRFIPKMHDIPVKHFMTESIVDKLENSDVNRAWRDLSEHWVSKLVYCKCLAKDNSTEHEYIVAYITDHEGKVARLLVERSPLESAPAVDDNNPQKTTHNLLDRLKAMQGVRISSNARTFSRVTSAEGLLGGLASSSRSVTSINSAVTVESMPRSSQDSSYKPVEANDVIRGLRPDEAIPDNVLRIFEPEPKTFSFLHFCVIVEDVHDQKPNYSVFRSQCYWFAMMVMGISMLQGGRVKIFDDKPQKKGTAEPPWITLNHYTSTNGEIPAGLELPIPSPSADDVKNITDVGQAGGLQIVSFARKKLPVINVSFNTIWEAGWKIRDHYNSLSIELSKVKNIVEAQIQQADERTQQANERAQRAEARIKALQEELAQAKAALGE